MSMRNTDPVKFLDFPDAPFPRIPFTEKPAPIHLAKLRTRRPLFPAHRRQTIRGTKQPLTLSPSGIHVHYMLSHTQLYLFTF
jgi:hypothetical protein